MGLQSVRCVLSLLRGPSAPASCRVPPWMLSSSSGSPLDSPWAAALWALLLCASVPPCSLPLPKYHHRNPIQCYPAWSQKHILTKLRLWSCTVNSWHVSINISMLSPLNGLMSPNYLVISSACNTDSTQFDSDTNRVCTGTDPADAVEILMSFLLPSGTVWEHKASTCIYDHKAVADSLSDSG